MDPRKLVLVASLLGVLGIAYSFIMGLIPSMTGNVNIDTGILLTGYGFVVLFGSRRIGQGKDPLE